MPPQTRQDARRRKQPEEKQTAARSSWPPSRLTFPPFADHMSISVAILLLTMLLVTLILIISWVRSSSYSPSSTPSSSQENPRHHGHRREQHNRHQSFSPGQIKVCTAIYNLHRLSPAGASEDMAPLPFAILGLQASDPVFVSAGLRGGFTGSEHEDRVRAHVRRALLEKTGRTWSENGQRQRQQAATTGGKPHHGDHRRLVDSSDDPYERACTGAAAMLGDIDARTYYLRVIQPPSEHGHGHGHGHEWQQPGAEPDKGEEEPHERQRRNRVLREHCREMWHVFFDEPSVAM